MTIDLTTSDTTETSAVFMAADIVAIQQEDEGEWCTVILSRDQIVSLAKLMEG